MASFTKTIPVQAPRTDTEAAEMASLIRCEPTQEQKRERAYYTPEKIDPRHKRAQELFEALCNAKTFSELEQASFFYEEFKGKEGRISGHYGKMISKNKCDSDFGNRINEKAAEVQKKIDIMVDKLPPEFPSDTNWDESFRLDSDSSYYSSSGDEEAGAGAGAGASKEGGRRKKRKSKKRKKKKKKKTRKKRKKRKTRKKRKLRKKKRRKTNRK
tara:strand:- start:189 stop:830 length:642 start_codon:yes stop_codon:yes gene_type:complete